MKKIFYKVILLLLPLSCLQSCDSYFDIELKQNMSPEQAYNSVRSIESGLNGAYYALGASRFYGRNVVALGDIAADNAQASPSSGHLVAIWSYSFTDAELVLEDIWRGGYQVIDRTTRTINGADALIAGGTLNEDELDAIYNYRAQCYGLRALAAHKLVQVFGLPYGTDSNASGGIVVVDKAPVEEFTKVSRSSVSATYTQVLADITSAKSSFALTSFSNDQFYMNRAALYALEARVMLDMGSFANAVNAATNAIDERDSPDVSNSTYLSMWSSISISDEDIFTIAKSEDDNLSANSLNTLYGSYRARMNTGFLNIFKSTDIRRGLFATDSYGLRPLKFIGLSTSAATSNIPVFRKSEMYLIIAEAEAKQGNVAAAQAALFYTAQRDEAITAEAMLPGTVADLLTFIAQERRRELFQEGFRWYDARRTGAIISVYDGRLTNFNVAKFVYPVPVREINAGFGVQQNEGWYNNLPK